MKLKAAIILSVVFHLSLFAIAIYIPTKTGSSGTVYRVDLIQMPAGGQSKAKSGTRVETRQRMKDLTAKKQPPKSKLRFPDKKNKKKRSKPKKKDLISVVKKKRNPPKEDPKTATVTRKQNLGSNVVTTGIGGTGSNAGSGAYGSRFGVGNFPYAYYIEALKNKISSSWYNALVSPGSSGRHVATVYFRILRSGQIRDLVLKQKSGIRTLDLSSLRAVENAAPFPPLPNQFTDRYLGVYFDFVWEKK